MNYLDVGRRYLFFRRSQHWSRAELAAYRDRRLRRIVRHAGAHVPYYRSLFRRIGLDPAAFRGRRDLHRIPTLDKQTVRTRRRELIADNAAAFSPRPVSTSGTTGTPLQLVLSGAARVDFLASLLRCYHWSGYRFFMRTLSLQSYYFTNRVLAYNPFLNVLRFDSCRLGPEAAIRALATINRMKPRFFMGFPFDLVMLTRFAADAGVTIAPPASVLCYGETLSDTKRDLLARALKCRIFDFYSHHESVAMVAECPYGNKHFTDDYGCHEILDEHGADVGAAGEGELVATGFANDAMPLIRYRTGDRVSVGDAPADCPCGRQLRRVRSIAGKHTDYLETPDGRVLSAVMSHAIDAAGGVVMSQCVQDALDHIVVNVVADDSYSAASQQALIRGLRRRLGPAVALDVVRVDQLEKRPGGKTPFLVSKIGNVAP
jgi:phenylacetate-CoA ligase